MADDAVAGASLGKAFRPVIDYLADLFMAERERWPLWSPVLFGAGIACYFALPVEPSGWIGITGAVLFSLAAFGGRRQSSALPLVCLAIALFAAGFGAAQLRTFMVTAPVLDGRYGPAPVIGQVIAVESRARGQRVTLDRVVLRDVAPADTPSRVRISLRRGDNVAVGDQIDVFAKLSPPWQPAAPGAYDFRRTAWFRQLGGTGFALGMSRPAKGVAEGEGISRPALLLVATRHAIAARIRNALPGEAGAVAAALITGDRSAISRQTLDSMRDSGLAHLLAISGLHMGLVAATLFFGLRAGLALVERLALRRPIKKYAAGAALAGSFLYLLLAGAPVPTQRAFVMTGLVLVAAIFDRQAISLRLVAWAAMIVLLLAPESLTGASFQMSFAAVVALVAVYEGGRGRISRWIGHGGVARRTALYVAGVAVTTIIASVATGAIGLHHFGRIAGYGLPANMLAVPLTALWIMPWAVIAMVLMPLGLESWGLAPMGWGIEAVLGVAGQVSSWPGAVHPVPAMPVAGLVMVALGGLWLCLWRCRWRYWGIAGIVAGLASVPLSTQPDVLISDNGKLMAVRLADGSLSLSSGRREKRTGRIWLERNGQKQAAIWPGAGVSKDGALRCDSLGCVFRAGNRTIALVKDGRALDEDCRSATILVSAVPVRGRCPAPGIVIDRFDLWRHGAYAIWLTKSGVRVTNVAEFHGDRPWAPSRGRH